MVNKRTYKALTAKQTAKVKRYTKQGKSQGAIAKLLHVSKQRVSTAQAKAKVGKRIASPFWKDVATHRGYGYTHKESIEIVKYLPKWRKAYKKRTGRARLSQTDKDNIRALRREQWLKTQKRSDEGETVSVEYEGETYYKTQQ